MAKTIVFQGDSVTDCNRSYETEIPNWALGCGYVAIAAGQLTADNPEQIAVYNRGVSGNRIVEVYSRWKRDTLNLRPDVISLLIGVNDTWRRFDSNDGIEPERYEVLYRMLLEWTRKELPETKLVLISPFALETGVVTSEWLEELAERGKIVRKLSEEFGTEFIDGQKLFDDLTAFGPANFWTPDGVHPAIAGHTRLAQAWLELYKSKLA